MLKSAEKNSTDFFVLCGFLVALDLSAVLLYGDDRPITPSASNLDSPFVFYLLILPKALRFGMPQ